MSEDKYKPGDVVRLGSGSNVRLMREMSQESATKLATWLVLSEKGEEGFAFLDYHGIKHDVMGNDTILARELAVEEAELAEREAKGRLRLELSRTPLHKESVVDHIKGKRPDLMIIDDVEFDRIVSSTDVDQGVKTIVRMGVKDGFYTVIDVSHEDTGVEDWVKGGYMRSENAEVENRIEKKSDEDSPLPKGWRKATPAEHGLLEYLGVGLFFVCEGVDSTSEWAGVWMKIRDSYLYELKGVAESSDRPKNQVARVRPPVSEASLVCCFNSIAGIPSVNVSFMDCRQKIIAIEPDVD